MRKQDLKIGMNKRMNQRLSQKMNRKGLLGEWIWFFFYIPLTLIVIIELFHISTQQLRAVSQTFDGDADIILQGVLQHMGTCDTNTQRCDPTILEYNTLTDKHIQELLRTSRDIGIKFGITEAPCEKAILPCEYNSDSAKGCATKIEGGDCTYERLKPLQRFRAIPIERTKTVWRIEDGKSIRIPADMVMVKT